MKHDEWKTGVVEYLFLNGEIVPSEQAVVHISTPAYRYGAMVFEGIRGYWNENERQIYLFRVMEHCRRLNQSMKMTRMLYEIDPEEMKANISNLIRKNDIQETVHLIYSAYLGGDGPMSSTGPIGTAIELRRLGTLFDLDKGIRCAISSWRRNADDASPMRIKASANYHNSRFALLQAKHDGYDNTILLTRQGKVSEGPGSCLFMVRNGRLITPGTDSDILESITRDTMIILAREALQEAVIERTVDRTELYIADELFFCGSGYEVVPIVSVDGLAVGNGKPGKITKALIQAYQDLVTGRATDHAEWRTPVYDSI